MAADYWGALERLKAGKPERVPKGAKITNDAVSLEAGCNKGTIKKSRPQFAKLIEAINEAAESQNTPARQRAARLAKAQGTAEELRAQLDAALAREMSLVLQLYEAREKIAQLTGDKVTPIRRPTTDRAEHGHVQ